CRRALPLVLSSFPTRRSSDLIRSNEKINQTDVVLRCLVCWNISKPLFDIRCGQFFHVPAEKGRCYFLCLLKCFFTMDSACHLFRSEEHTSELQSRFELVCRLL